MRFLNSQIIHTIFTPEFLNSHLHLVFGAHLLYQVQSHAIFQKDSEEETLHTWLDIGSRRMLLLYRKSPSLWQLQILNTVPSLPNSNICTSKTLKIPVAIPCLICSKAYEWKLSIELKTECEKAQNRVNF